MSHSTEDCMEILSRHLADDVRSLLAPNYNKHSNEIVFILLTDEYMSFFTRATPGVTDADYQRLLDMIRQQEVEISVLEGKLRHGGNQAECIDSEEEVQAWKNEANKMKRKLIELEKSKQVDRSGLGAGNIILIINRHERRRS
jgi:hypothetical protein